MAKSTTERQEHHKFWTCELTPSPARVYPNERLSLFVTLSHPRLAEWSSDNDENSSTRSAEFRSAAPTIGSRRYSTLKPNKNPAVITMPALPEGDYDVSVKVDFLRNEYSGPPHPFPRRRSRTACPSLSKPEPRQRRRASGPSQCDAATFRFARPTDDKLWGLRSATALKRLAFPATNCSSIRCSANVETSWAASKRA